MKRYSLKQYLIAAFFLQILVIGVLFAILGYYTIEHDIIARTQKELARKINAAQIVYDNQLEKIRTALLLAEDTASLISAKGMLGIDYVYETASESIQQLKSPIAKTAFKGGPIGGSRIIEADELKYISNVLLDRAKTKIEYTPKAKPVNKKFLESALAIEYAIPLKDRNGRVFAVRYAGRIINKDFSLVDEIRDLVFGRELHQNLPLGTVTVFQGDVRIATNVLDSSGERAIGTRVSEAVYDKVLNKGLPWYDRAFVVSQWYLTAYSPIKDIDGDIVGILYVGILEKPFLNLKMNRIFIFFSIITAVIFLALFVSYFLASKITKPLHRALKASAEISEDRLSYRLKDEGSIVEFSRLADSFNSMAEKLKERQDSLHASKEELETMNKRYLDLVGLVSHELKGILAPIVLNTYSLKNGLLGPVNGAQGKALDSVNRNLDYLAQTVKNFLNLSRVENQDMVLNKTEVSIKEDVFDMSVEALKQKAEEKKVSIINNITPGIKVNADLGLLQVVANNLLTNALKYGDNNGKIVLSSKIEQDDLTIEVYNQGRPIPNIDLGKLFKRFSRITYTGTEKVKGTGIGLFITKEIILRHQGRIWVKPREDGNSFIFTLKRV